MHDANENSRENKALVVVTKTSKNPTGMKLTVSHSAFTDSGTTVHMMKDVSEITARAISLYINVGTAGKRRIMELA